MDYNSQIEEIKSKLDNYSFDSSLYDEIYKKAYATISNAYDESIGAIDAKLALDSRQAVGSNALQTRSLAEQLNSYGLASSGESGLLRINQAVSLNNALANLNAAASDTKATLSKEKNLSAFNLEKEIAAMKHEAMEADKGRLYDRLSQLERLGAENEQFYDQLDSEESRFYSNLAQDKSQFEAELAFRQDQFNKEHSLDQKYYWLDLASLFSSLRKKDDEQESTDKETESATSISPNNALAEAAINGLSTKVSEMKQDPEIDARTMAANIVKNDAICNGGSIYSPVGQDSIFKTFGRIVASNNFSDAYVSDMLSYLQSCGFNKQFNIPIINGKDVHNVVAVYNKAELTYYQKAIDEGKNQYDAMDEAKKLALEDASAKATEMKLEEDVYNTIIEIVTGL